MDWRSFRRRAFPGNRFQNRSSSAQLSSLKAIVSKTPLDDDDDDADADEKPPLNPRTCLWTNAVVNVTKYDRGTFGSSPSSGARQYRTVHGVIASLGQYYDRHNSLSGKCCTHSCNIHSSVRSSQTRRQRRFHKYHRYQRYLSASRCTVLSTRSGTEVLGRPLPTSLRRRFSAASQVLQSTTPGPSATPVANIRPTGFLCCWPVDLEIIT